MEKAKTRKEVASEYGVTPKTFKIWLDKAEIILQGKSPITPKMYKIIKEKFG
jgi:hypothetical protein